MSNEIKNDEIQEQLEAAQLALEQERARLEATQAELTAVKRMGELANSQLSDWKQSPRPAPSYGWSEFANLDATAIGQAIQNHMDVQMQASSQKVTPYFKTQYAEAVTQYVYTLRNLKHPQNWPHTSLQYQQNQPHVLKAKAKQHGQTIQLLAERLNIKPIIRILDDSAVDAL